VAYYQLIALDNEQDILSETIRNQEEVLDVIRYQKEAGRANELVVQQFKAQQLNTKTLEREVMQSILETENRINFLLGRYPQPIERNKTLLFRDLPLEIASGVPSKMLLNRPDIRAANFQVQSSKFDVKAANAEFLPSLTLTAGIGYQAFNPKFLFTTPASLAYSLVGGLAAPLINKNAIQARFNTAKSSQIIAMYEYQKTILTGYTEVVNELSKINALREISELKTQQSQVLEQSVETSNELYTSAKATYLEVLIAQQNAIQAKLEMVESHRRQLMSSVNIYKALGGGWK
jgi:multidrug efflux system outer membrane protein